MCCAQTLSRVQLFATPWTVAHQSSVHGILSARILEWVGTSSFRGSSRPRHQIKTLIADSLLLATPGKPLKWACIILMKYTLKSSHFKAFRLIKYVCMCGCLLAPIVSDLNSCVVRFLSLASQTTKSCGFHVQDGPFFMQAKNCQIPCHRSPSY